MTHTTHSITKQRVPAAPHDGSTACQCQTHVCVPPTALTLGHMFATRCFKTPSRNKPRKALRAPIILAQSWIRVRSVAGVGSQTSTHGRHTLNWALCGPCATVSCPQRPARVLCRVATRVARLSEDRRVSANAIAAWERAQVPGPPTWSPHTPVGLVRPVCRRVLPAETCASALGGCAYARAASTSD